MRTVYLEAFLEHFEISKMKFLTKIVNAGECR